MLARRLAALWCSLAAVGSLAGCGAPLHGSAAGAQVATASPSAAPTPYPVEGGSAHGYSGPLPTLDATCPSATEVSIAPGRPPDDKLPDYGFGAGPAYLSGQVSMGHALWHAAGETGLVLVAPSFSGAVTVIGSRIGTAGKAYFDGTPTLTVPPRAPQAWWRYWRGTIRFDSAGCYELDISGSGVRESVVVQVDAGSPLPG